MKKCISCSKNKDESAFYWQIQGKRRFNKCKTCMSRDNSKRAMTEGTRAYFHHKYRKKKEQATHRGIEFTVSFEHFTEVRSGDTCFYCSNKIDGVKTVDRIDPRKGYTKENIVLSCAPCNRLKSNYTPDDIVYLEKVLEVLKKAV